MPGWGGTLATMLRPIDDACFGHALDALGRGFPDRPAASWTAGLERLAALGGPASTGIPLGWVLEHGGRAVGVVLTLATLRRGPDGPSWPLVNVSSWYVDPEHRWRGPAMLRSVLRAHDAVYTDLTPTPSVAKLLPALGFERLSEGRAVHLLPLSALEPARGARVEPIDGPSGLLLDEPTRGLLDAHRRIGCTAAVLRTDDAATGLLFRATRIRRVPAVELLWCTDHAALRRGTGALARWLLRRGVAAMLTDLRPEAGLVGHLRRTRNARFVRGARGRDWFATRTDFAGSELCLLEL